MQIHLGYEVGTGKPVEIPLRHLAVTGQTQLSGKTTTLEALIARSGLRAVAFVTKRAEGGFQDAHTVAPYFRERADWQFVASILEATLRERLKFQRPWIMKVCKGARKLADVAHNVDAALEKARGLSESVYTELAEYLKLVTPQIERLPYKTSLDLSPGINVMDLAEYTTELQSLVIRSVLEWVYEREKGVITIIPEAWEFIPQMRGSPVLLAAEELIRKGGGLKNFMWIDSQDIAGVHKNVLRQVGVWILGVQREEHEVKRTLAHVTGTPKPKVDDVRTLGLGQFFVCFDKTMVKCYAQPAWMAKWSAEGIAAHSLDPRNVESGKPPSSKPRLGHQEDEVYKEKYETEHRERERIENELKTTRELLKDVQTQLTRLQGEKRQPGKRESAVGSRQSAVLSPVPSAPASAVPSDLNGFYEAFRSRLLRDNAVLSVLAQRPEIEVKIERPTISLDGGTLKGKLAAMIVEGFFESAKNGNTAFQELRGRRGFPTAKPNVYRELDKLTEMGFLMKEAGGYQAVPEMKVRIIE